MLHYNLLFRWFLDLNLTNEIWDNSSFTTNQQRLIEHDTARLFFCTVLAQAEAKGWMSDTHFTVDGTLVGAWPRPRPVEVRPAAGRGAERCARPRRARRKSVDPPRKKMHPASYAVGIFQETTKPDSMGCVFQRTAGKCRRLLTFLFPINSTLNSADARPLLAITATHNEPDRLVFISHGRN